MAGVQVKRIEGARPGLLRDGRLGRGEPGRASAVDRRLGRGISVAMLASLPVWAALAYALAG